MNTPVGQRLGRAVVATVVTALPLLALALLGASYAWPPLAASAGLAAVAPTAPTMRWQAVIGGYAVSVGAGLGAGAMSHSMAAAALASGLAVGVTVGADVFHPPAIAAAYLATRYPGDRFELGRGIVVGVVLVIAATYLCRLIDARRTRDAS